MNKINILCVLLAPFLVVGCVPAITGLRQHKVRIVDAERSVPVTDATIELHYYPSAPEAPDPDRPRATANDQGEISIQSKPKPAIWQVRAEGYIEQQLSSRDGALPTRYAAHATGAYDGVIHLYQMPEPQLTIFVSSTYRGPLTINLEPAPGFDYVLVDEINVAFAAVDPEASHVQEAVGTRVFTETASAQGTVDLVVTPLLYDIKTPQLQIRDSSGVLPYRDIANPQDTERGVWGSVTEDDKRLHHQIRLFVGTLEDYRKSLESVQ
jgi:hypothetical protein